ncbi:MAG: hypothetical protein RPR97_10490 [Colwellia sp.]
MLSRRGFIMSAMCTAVSSTVYSAMPSGMKYFATSHIFDTKNSITQHTSISYQDFAEQKNTWFRFANQDHVFDAKVVEIRDMNCDERLEQFSVVLETREAQQDYTGTYRAYHESDKRLRSLDISLEKLPSEKGNSRYITLYSTFRAT